MLDAQKINRRSNKLWRRSAVGEWRESDQTTNRGVTDKVGTVVVTFENRRWKITINRGISLGGGISRYVIGPKCRRQLKLMKSLETDEK